MNKYQEALDELRAIHVFKFHPKVDEITFIPNKSAVLTLQKLVDRATPLKPHYDEYGRTYRCLKCEGVIREFANFCPNCGNAIERNGKDDQ